MQIFGEGAKEIFELTWLIVAGLIFAGGLLAVALDRVITKIIKKKGLYYDDDQEN